MKIIDCYINTIFDNKETFAVAKANRIDFSFKGLKQEMKKNNIVGGITISDPETLQLNKIASPIQFNYFKRVCVKFPSIKACVGVNPAHINKLLLEKISSGVKEGWLCGVKIFSGYFHAFPSDKRYFSLYELAEKLNIPIVLHAGSVQGSNAMLKFAHPLHIDEIAVKFPKTKFIISHFGNPWVLDVAALLDKNPNVYTTLAAIYTGRLDVGEPMKNIVERLRQAYFYSSTPEKIIYASDWPLVRMEENILLAKKIIPKEDWEKVFYDNAKRIFKL